MSIGVGVKSDIVFCTRPHNGYFQLCGPCSVHCNHSTLSLKNQSSNRQHIYECLCVPTNFWNSNFLNFMRLKNSVYGLIFKTIINRITILSWRGAKNQATALVFNMSTPVGTLKLQNSSITEVLVLLQTQEVAFIYIYICISEISK